MRDRISFMAKEILGKRSVQKGDPILISEPFAYVVNTHQRGQYCDYCLTSHRKKSLTSCKECHFIWYCDDMCRFNGQSVHKWECAYLKKIQPKEPPAFSRLLARVMNRLKHGGDTHTETYGENKSRKFKDLMNHYRDIKEDQSRMKDVRELIEELKEFNDDGNFPNESDFIGIYGRVLVNRYCLMDDYHTPIGSALYLAGSIFDHSCVPNAYPTFERNKVVIRSLVDWPELDYNKVFISYIDVDMTKQQRIDQLRSFWYFICQCPMCSSNDRDLYENCMHCENPMCRELIQIPEKPNSQFSCREQEPIVCPECRCAVDEETITNYQSAIAFSRHRLSGIKEENPNLETCLAIIEKQSNLVPPLNVWRVRTMDYAFNASCQAGVWLRAMEYGSSNLEGMRLHYGPQHPTVGLFLLKLSKVYMYLKIYREGIRHGDEASKILKIALGPNHLLITEELKRIMAIANEDVEILLERRLEEKKDQEHSRVCKHCGRRRGTFLQLEKEITTEKRKTVTNGEAENGVSNGQVKEIKNGDSEKEQKPLKTKQMCKFVPSGETKASLSKRVLEYLLSLEDF